LRNARKDYTLFCGACLEQNGPEQSSEAAKPVGEFETFRRDSYLINPFSEEKVNIRTILIIFAMLSSAYPSWAQPARKQQPAQVQPAGKELSPEEIIKAFSDKETEFYEAWKQYTYHQLAEVKVTEVDGRPISNERLVMAWEIVFRDDGTRENRLVDRRGRLKNVQFTPKMKK
jgi:hypothetical protein